MGINKIVIVDSWGASPAKVHRPTGTMYINRDWIGKLNEDKWAFIMAHERGHVVENTRNEYRADELASQKYFEQKRSPRNSVKALAEVLNFSSPSHLTRVQLQFKRAAEYDCKINNHKKSCEMVKRLYTETPTEVDFQMINIPSGNSISNFSDVDFNYDEFVSAVDECRGKKGRELRQCRKTVKKTNKQDRKDTKNDAKANSRVILAEQGIDVTSERLKSGGDLLKGVGAAAAGVGAAGLGIGAGKGLAKGLPNIMGGGSDGGGGADGDASGGGGLLASAQGLLGGGSVQGLVGESGGVQGLLGGNKALPINTTLPVTKASTANEVINKNKEDNTLLYVGIGFIMVLAFVLLRR